MKKILLFWLLAVMTLYSQEKVTVYFDLDMHRLNTESNKILENWIAQNKKVEVLKIYGFCDSLSTEKYNDKLAERRIQSVVDVLIKGNVALSAKTEKTAFGERFEQSAIQSENRKVEIYYRVVTDTTLSEKISQLKVGEKLRLKNLNFYNRSGRVVPKSIPVLEELYQIMKNNPKLKIDIQGHICCQPQGDLEDISTLRCKTVYNYLIEKGIDRSRLTYKGYGSTMPLYPIPEKNEFERDENRRVEIMIVANQ